MASPYKLSLGPREHLSAFSPDQAVSASTFTASFGPQVPSPFSLNSQSRALPALPQPPPKPIPFRGTSHPAAQSDCGQEKSCFDAHPLFSPPSSPSLQQRSASNFTISLKQRPQFLLSQMLCPHSHHLGLSSIL